MVLSANLQQAPFVESSPADEQRGGRSRTQQQQQQGSNDRQELQTVGENFRNGDDSMERPSSSSSYEESFGGAASRERMSPQGSRLGASRNPSVEPEPSSVVARLKKEALENPRKEQSFEELLSSMGVSLFADQRLLDYSMATAYSGPTVRDGVLKDKPSKNSEIEESGSLESIPVAVPLSLPRIKKPSVSKQVREVLELAARERQIQMEMNQKLTSQRPQKAGTASTSTSASQSDVKASEDLAQPSMELSESLKEISNGPSTVPSAEEGTPEESAPDPTPGPGMAREKQLSKELSHSELCSIDVSLPRSPGVDCASPVSQRASSMHGRESSASSLSPSPSAVLAVSESVVDEGLHPLTDRSDVEKPDNVSMVFSPESLHNDPDSYVNNKSFESVGERSELMNIANHGGDRPPVPATLPWKKRGCAGCGKANLLLEKEYCMACGAKYCGNCLLLAMGSMPEGRKCVACLGRPILGSRRPFIGKPSRLLKHLLSPLEVQQIMKAEKEGPANQLRPEQVVVNNRQLSHEELAVLLGCSRPPLKLKPGKFWYDGQTGLWGKDGHRPDSIVTPSLKLGGNLLPNASNGKTQVFMNGRELGKLELKMLKFAGVNCTPETHLWVENDGSYSEEGFKNVKGNIWGKEGNLWEKASIKLLYPFFSLPTPRSNVGIGDGSARHSNRFLGLLDPMRIHKLLLLGHEGSGRSTIFKQIQKRPIGHVGSIGPVVFNTQIFLEACFKNAPLLPKASVSLCPIGKALSSSESSIVTSFCLAAFFRLSYLPAKILYNEGFTKEELVSFKSLIQANIYKYLAILLEGREHFEEEDDDLANAPASQELSSATDLGSSQNSSSPQADVEGFLKCNDGKHKQKETYANNNIYRLEPNMKELSDWFMENMVHGNLETTVPHSSTHVQDHASKIEQLWLNSAVQATFQRKAELAFLPDVASVFLDRVVEVCRSDFEPSETDILLTEGLSQGSGLVQIEISLDDKDFGSWQDADTTCIGLDRYQVIRVGGKGMSDRHKWLDMFEDVRAVVFCVSLSDYNSLWNDRTGNPSNKMIQTRDLFESILRHPCFQDTPFVLLLNKYDVFEDKIEKGVPLTTCPWFSDFRPVGTSHYTAQNQAQQAYQYIAHKYKELFNSVNCTGRKLFTFQLNALDKTTVSGAFHYVKAILKWEEHKAAGWGMIPEESSYSTDVSSFSQRSMPRQPDLFRRQHY